MATKHYTEN